MMGVWLIEFFRFPPMMMVSLIEQDRFLYTIDHNPPVLDEFLIGDNISTELNNTLVKVLDVKNIKEAVLLTTDHLGIEQYQNISKFENLMHKVKMYRQWGDCYGYYLVATGFAQIMMDPIMSVWDTMALIPIISGAGGIITDYQGYNTI